MFSTNWDYLPQIFGNKITTTWVFKKKLPTQPGNLIIPTDFTHPSTCDIHMKKSQKKSPLRPRCNAKPAKQELATHGTEPWDL